MLAVALVASAVPAATKPLASDAVSSVVVGSLRLSYDPALWTPSRAPDGWTLGCRSEVCRG